MTCSGTARSAFFRLPAIRRVTRSLLVRLPRTGPVLLSADVAHDRYNLEHRCVPTMNSDARLTRESMDKIAAIVRAENAQLWLNHDVAQSATIPHAPRCNH